MGQFNLLVSLIALGKKVFGTNMPEIKPDATDAEQFDAFSQGLEAQIKELKDANEKLTSEIADSKEKSTDSSEQVTELATSLGKITSMLEAQAKEIGSIKAENKKAFDDFTAKVAGIIAGKKVDENDNEGHAVKTDGDGTKGEITLKHWNDKSGVTQVRVGG